MAQPSSRRRTACQARHVHPARPPRYPSSVDPTRPDGADRHPSPHPGRLWRHPDPKLDYDVIVVGGGGHGLATAYYLAKNHGITNVAVLERGWLGGGNMARNTTIIRSNYLWDESAAIYEHSLKLWEDAGGGARLRRAFQPARRAHARAQPARRARRRCGGTYANRLNGVDAEWLSLDRGRALLPDPERGATSATRCSERASAARWHRQTRPRRVGLRPRRGCARRRPHPKARR